VHLKVHPPPRTEALRVKVCGPKPFRAPDPRKEKVRVETPHLKVPSKRGLRLNDLHKQIVPVLGLQALQDLALFRKEDLSIIELVNPNRDLAVHFRVDGSALGCDQAVQLHHEFAEVFGEFLRSLGDGFLSADFQFARELAKVGVIWLSANLHGDSPDPGFRLQAT
jgi:hypothetical protein